MKSFILDIPLTMAEHKVPEKTWCCCASCLFDFEISKGKFVDLELGDYGKRNILYCQDCADNMPLDMLASRTLSSIDKYKLENVFKEDHYEKD